MSAEDGEEFSAPESSRREFITRYGAMAFVAPVIASFTLDGFARDKDQHGHHPRHGNPNQCQPNQSVGDQVNQGYPNQCQPNQSVGDQVT